MHSGYKDFPLQGGIRRENRRVLETLHQRARGPFSPSDAADFLGVDLPRARRLLTHLASQGWLVRVRRGLYAAVPLDSHHPGDWQEDPWVIAAKSFHPCYVGGWSACEYWGLTDQLFRELFVVTARHVRHRTLEVQVYPMRLKVLPESKLFGTRQLWRGQVAVLVSDPSRTIADILDDPAMGGGIRHVAEVVSAYFASDHRDDDLLLAYAERMGNRTLFKRLGYLIEVLQLDAAVLLNACRQQLSSGITTLDPTVRAAGRIAHRWNLRVNVELSPQELSA